MDDETYFVASDNEWCGKFYYTDPKSVVSDRVRFRESEKFPKKLMVWLAIGRKGTSEPVFFRAGMAVTSEVYRTKCLPVLKKFIDRFYKGNIIFWPDLASAHYARRTLEELDALKIPYVARENNPPNAPQLRPIEDFWAILKRRVYNNGYKPASIASLQLKMKNTIESIEIYVFENLFTGLGAKVRKADRHGPMSLIH